MTGVFAKNSEFTCRGCAATHVARAKSSTFSNVCQYCWDRFQQFLAGDRPSDHRFNEWLARKLYMDVQRKLACGVTGRCEATASATRGWIDGFGKQCRNLASAMRNGRRVCGKHARATQPIFVDESIADPYQAMTRVMASLASVDPEFKLCIEAALAQASPRNDLNK